MVILTTAAMVIGRKISDSRAEKKERKQGLLSVGNSDAAKSAFAAQTARTMTNAPGSGLGIQRSGTEIKYEDPDSLDYPSSVRTVATPADNVTDSPDAPSSAASMRSNMPPPYSPRLVEERPLTTSSIYSHDSDSATLLSSDGTSLVSADTTSMTSHSIRIRTKGSELKSGFPYHPSLFELQVHPTKWEAFTTQLIETTKFSLGDHAQVWATAAGVACTGALLTSVLVGRGMGTRVQEKKVKSGLLDTSDDGLGATLQRWNDGYFRERGLRASLELSQSATKNGRNQSKLIQKGVHWYSERQDRDRKREERKFAIVVTKLEPEVSPLLAGEAVVEMPGDAPTAVCELSAAADVSVAEMPADDNVGLVELPGDFAIPGGVSLGFGAEEYAPTAGLSELESDTKHLLMLTKTTLHCEDFDAAELDGDLEEPLMVTGDTHAALHKETT